MASVRVVGVTQPVTEDIKSVEHLIAYQARVSNTDNQDNLDYKGLLRYLWNHKHLSPFEMVNATLEIETTRDISRQILRHRSFTFQEFSQRYAEVQSFEEREARMQDPVNRQNSLETTSQSVQESFLKAQNDVLDVAQAKYLEALEMGIAKEQARALLPEGLAKTKMYMNGTLRSWLHYIDLRGGNGTQKEHMEIANLCREALRPHFPLIIDSIVGDTK